MAQTAVLRLVHCFIKDEGGRRGAEASAASTGSATWLLSGEMATPSLQ